MMFISYYTPNGRYPALAKQLGESLRRFGLQGQIHKLDINGDGKLPHNAKAQFIQHMLWSFRRPVIWMDCDTEVIQLPYLLCQNQYDFMIYSWHAEQDNKLGVAYDPDKLLCSGGVQYWGYTAAAIELVTRWEERLRWDLRPDDQVLDSVFNEHRPPVKPFWLPKTYNRMAFHWPDVAPVIDHHYTDGQHGKAVDQETASSPIGTMTI